jgi:dipeptidyl aminopeptidase/acylaminoacyl peptidase
MDHWVLREAARVVVPSSRRWRGFGLIVLAIAVLAVGPPDSAEGNVDATSMGWKAVVSAFADPTTEPIGLDLLRPDKAHPLPLTRGQADGYPSWSPDGKSIAFVRDSGRRGIYVIAGTGGRPRLLVPLTRGEQDRQLPAWSPDGTRLAYTLECSFYPPVPCAAQPSVEVVNVSGGAPRRIFAHAATAWSTNDDGQEESDLSWAPNGKSLLCVCSRNYWQPQRAKVYTVAADGSSHYLLSLPGDGIVGPAYWSPDGTSIAYESHCVSERAINHDWYCNLSFLNPRNPSDNRVRNGLDVWMGSICWPTGNTLYAYRWRKIVEISRYTGRHRVAMSGLDLPSTGGGCGFEGDGGSIWIIDRDGRLVEARSHPYLSGYASPSIFIQ